MEKLIPSLTFCILTWPAFAADAPTTKEMNLESSKLCALHKAEQVILEKFSSYDKKNRKPVIVDDDENWKFYYELPPLTLGGTPVVIINKKTCEVLKIYSTQ